jgi:hypothetical protein
MIVYVKKDPSAPIDSRGTRRQKELKSDYPSNSYQKILDYHIAEILLSTIVLAVIALLRLRH